MSITRRLLLRNTAAAGAVAAAMTAPVILEASNISPRKRLDAAIEELRSAMEICAREHAGCWSVFMIGNRPSGKDDVTIATSDGGKIDLLGSQPKGSTIKAYIDDGSPLLADDVTGTTAYADWEARRALS